MPPSSRGFKLFKPIRWRQEIARQVRNASKFAPSKNAPKSKIPPQSSPPAARAVEPIVQDVKAEAHKILSTKDGLLSVFFHSPKYRVLRRVLLASPVIVLGFLHSPYDLLTANGQSMSPFLNPNSSDGLPTKDTILVRRQRSPKESAGQKAGRDLGSADEDTSAFQRGQIVIFPTPHQPNKLAVKRIIAIPGDVVQPLAGYAGGDQAVVVPWNHLWVEGDIGLRSESMDSNWYGPISQNLVLGEVIAVWSSWWNWTWLDWRNHKWPAREKGRVEENAIMEAAVDPDAVSYSDGWRNGSIALILERIRKQPEKVLYTFVHDAKARQETRRLYNNALYVANVATLEQDKQLAQDLMEEMEDVYGREALVYGIREKRKPRDRGQIPNLAGSKLGEKADEKVATTAEAWLKQQGYELERNSDGSVRTRSPATR